MENFKIITGFVVELLNALAWPLIVMISVLILKKPITNLITRTKQFDYGDKSVKFEQQDSKKPKESPIDNNSNNLSPETNSAAERILKSYIEIEIIPKNEEAMKLINVTKFYIIIAKFEWIFNNIFGSQIRILDDLNSINETSKEYLKKYYDYVASRNPDVYNTYDYNSYLGFLISTELIKENNNQIQITKIGEDFLKFLVESKKNKQKAL